jgi:hypothetical protein
VQRLLLEKEQHAKRPLEQRQKLGKSLPGKKRLASTRLERRPRS